jgi:hypothetical protein
MLGIHTWKLAKDPYRVPVMTDVRNRVPSTLEIWQPLERQRVREGASELTYFKA